MDASEQLRPFVPRLIYDWVRRTPDEPFREIDGSLAFIDISGFTSLTERLARKGRIGAEEMNDVLNDLFGELIPVAYDDGAGLVKWGGDAALLLFDGDEHEARACRAAINMQRTIRTAGRLHTSAGQVRLRMSIGINSGSFNLFLVGDPAIHRELVIAGPASTGTVLMEQTAEAGEVVVSATTAAAIEPAALGAAKGEGFLLRRAPDARSHPAQPRPDISGVDLRMFVPAAVRDYLLEEGQAQPEHRRITAAFLEFTGTDRLLAADGPEAAAAAIDACVRVVQTAALRDGVGFFESDVSRDGFRIMLIVGAPQSAGHDEDRMLATLRTVLETPLRLPARIGTNAGHVFSAYFGPPFRKTYSVKGDSVNLAARLMAKAPPGELYTTAEVLDHSMTRFDTTELEPFLVKGKRHPVRAWSVGPRVGVRDLSEGIRRFPLSGREKEFAELTRALAEAREERIRIVELIGESGIGKSRLVDELRPVAADMRQVGAVGEAYTASTPYVAWRSVLRELFGLGWEDTSDVVVQRLREIAVAFDPERTPWLPLIATATDAEMEPTPEVRDLDPTSLRPRLHESVLAFLRAVQPGPTLFVFENAHLMDEASADLLSAICRADADLPWLLVVARRPEDDGFRAPDAPGVRRLEIGPIDRDTALTLAEAATDEAPLPRHGLEAAVDRSGGNPQFLLDLVSSSAAGDELPASVEAAAVVRIDRLPPSTRDLVRRASVFGLAFHPRFFDDVLDEGTPRPDASTWAGLAEFFEEEDDGYLRFRRAVVRDAAYSGLPFRIRQRVHAIAGRLFEEMVEDPDESAGLLSLHFSAAGEWAKAYRYATASAAHAARINAPIEASRLFRRAIEAGRRSDADDDALAGLWERLGDVLRLAGLFVEAKRAYAEAIARCNVDVVRARLMLKRSVIEENMGRFPQMLRWLTKARKQVGDDRSSDAATQRARIDARYAGGLQAEGRNVEAISMAMDALAEAEAAGSNEAAAEAHNILGMANVMLGRSGSTEHWQAALGIFEELEDLNGQAMISLNLGGGAYFEGRWTDALARFERAREMYERLGRPVDVTLARMNVAEILADQGWYEEAKSSLHDAVRVWRAAEDRYSLGFCLSYLGRIEARRGRLDEAHAAFAQAREEFLYVGAQGDALEVDVREAECLLYEGRPADALALVDDVFARSEEPGAGTLAPMLLRIRGYGLLAQGDAEGAARAFDASLEAGNDQGADHEVAFTLQAWVRLSRRTGAEPDPSMVQESGRLLGRLGIIAVPAFPL